ncbi:MAG: tetratricopeptide repeat protein [Solidesulfovibrio sp. DCME]|uniref:tetratricopeptide repeat protein n=1 Tax=Solidesulfovibrio sp. DCME TaxID=3447380 RepID=UPI003D12B47F
MPQASAATDGEQTSVQLPAMEDCRILGVYSMVRQTQIGQGTTSRGHDQKTYWFVRRSPEGEYFVQALNANSIPSGPVAPVTRGEFLAAYQPQSGYYEKRCLPFIESLKKKIAQADRLLAEGDLDAAEKEFIKALLLDEKHPKANIALGNISLQKGDGKKLAAALRRIFDIDVLFTEQERHLFNEFAISLRKEQKFAEAVAFYEKALARNDTDENLHFNIARAKAEAGDPAGAMGHLERALALRPDFAHAQRFLSGLRAGEPDRDDALPLPDITASIDHIP